MQDLDHDAIAVQGYFLPAALPVRLLKPHDIAKIHVQEVIVMGLLVPRAAAVLVVEVAPDGGLAREAPMGQAVTRPPGTNP